MYIAWQESLQGFIIVPILCGFPEMLSAPHQHKTAALTPSDQFHHQHTYLLLPLPSKVLCQSLLFCLISHLNCCKSVLDTDCITGLLYKSIIYFLLHISKWFDCRDCTVGNLHSFSDNGNFSPQILVQSTYIFLKCSENYFGIV